MSDQRPTRLPDVFSQDEPEIVDGDVIEAAKENIQPLTFGRRATTLSAVLSTPHAHRESKLAAARQRLRINVEVALEDDRLDEIYKTGHRIMEGNRRLADVTALVGKKNPNIQVLEIGAGTGSATAEILPRINGSKANRMYDTYTYSDVTPFFLKTGQDRFATFKGMEYAVFDMEKPSVAESQRDKYDVVIASNAVHATSDILNTLRNITFSVQQYIEVLTRYSIYSYYKDISIYHESKTFKSSVVGSL